MTERPDHREGPAGDSGWWIMLKVALFVAVPTAIVYVTKLLMD